MACCIVAALILAHIMAVLRRWGVFWGVVRPGEFDDPDTLMRRVRGWLARPGVRVAVAALVAVEIGSFATWAYLQHGTHIYQIGDQTLASLRGESVIYSGSCGRDGKDRMVRIVIGPDGKVRGEPKIIAIT